ncbi:MAG: hypothetical protein K2Q45_02510 [Nitrosomonas sp.]|nr:hypothetical protein [Nitrosomonas sp.]
MNHLFENFEPPASIHVRKGDSSLVGVFTCNYCKRKCAEHGRFQVFADDRFVGEKNFCLPECAAAFNLYKSNAEEAQTRHYLLERFYKRRIIAAPHEHALKTIDRGAWILKCRASLTPAEMAIADMELVVQQDNFGKTK